MAIMFVLLLSKVLCVCCSSTDGLLLGDVIKSFVENIGGAAKLQERFDQLPKETFAVNASKYVDSFAAKLEKKTVLSTKALTNLRNNLINQYKQNENWVERQPYSCCNYPSSKLQISNLWKSLVDYNNVCDMKPGDQEDICNQQTGSKGGKQKVMFELLKGAYDAMNYESHHVFFGDEITGNYVQYPAMQSTLDCDKCRRYDPKLRSWYTEALTPSQGKIIVIVAHFKYENVLEQQKKVIKTVLNTIGAKDKVVLMVMGEQSIASYPNDNCLRKLETATPIIIQKLKSFVDKQRSRQIKMNITKTFEDAFRHLKNEMISKKKVIFFVTSSKDPTLDYPTDDIVKSNSKANNQFSSGNGLILLVTVARNGDLTKAAIGAYKRIASQDKNLGIHFMIKNDEDIPGLRQKMFELTVGKTNEIHFTLPYFDINGLGRMIDACIPLYEEKLYGVACIAFLSAELLNIKSEPEFEESLDSYAFLVDEQGITYMHPKYEEPILETDKAFPVNIKNLETAKAFNEIYESMIDRLVLFGTRTIYVNVSAPRGDIIGGSKKMFKEYTYSWKKIPSSSFWLTVVVSSLSKQKMKLGDVYPDKNQTTLYHRFNVPFWKLCKIHKLYPVRDSSTITMVRELYMQPSVFYKQQNMTTIQNLMDFFDYKKGYEGGILRDSSTARFLRNYIIGTAMLDEIWKHSFREDIIWVYVGLSNGLFRIYYGNNMHIDYDPRIRPWYRLAINSPEEYVVTAPYKGYTTQSVMITMAKRIHMAHNSDQIVGVIGVDVNIKWLTKYISKENSCNQNGHSCIVIDKSGSVIYHESFTENINLSQSHITQKEPHLSRHLLKKGHMVKEHCIGYHKVTLNQTETIAHYQWFYKLDHITSTIDEMDGDSKSCVRYTIIPIKRTNLLLIDLQSTCTIDLPCLCTFNEDSIPVCHKSFTNGDLYQCECPCYDFQECPINVPRESTLLCQPPNFRLGIAVDDYHNWQQFDQNKCHIKECNAPTLPTCNPSSSKSQCNGSGCQWCHKTADGESLSNPFCSEKSTCIGGFLQSCEVNDVIDDNDDDDKNSNENRNITISTTVVVVVLLIIVLFGIVYWRNNLKNDAPNANIYEEPGEREIPPAVSDQSQRNLSYLAEFEPGVDDYTASRIPVVDDPQYGGSHLSV